MITTRYVRTFIKQKQIRLICCKHGVKLIRTTSLTDESVVHFNQALILPVVIDQASIIGGKVTNKNQRRKILLIVLLALLLVLTFCKGTLNNSDIKGGERLMNTITPNIVNTSTTIPTKPPFILPDGDFQFKWDIYNREYNSLGGILTITRKEKTYTAKIVYSDDSYGYYSLTKIDENENYIYLTDLSDRMMNYSYYGDYLSISKKDGSLCFIDKDGFIYEVRIVDF